MDKRYSIEAEAIDPSLTTNEQISIVLKKADRVERKALDSTEDTFGIPTEEYSIWSKIKWGINFIFAPLRKPQGMTNFGLFLVFVYVLALIRKILFFLPLPIREPFLRGWRLEVVRKVALNEKNLVPGLRPDLLIKYFIKGLVLMVMRYLYFIPLVVIAFLSGLKIIKLVKEIGFYLWDVWQDTNSMGIGEFLGVKVLPQAGVEILIQLVVLGFYMVFVWPIYRIIMIQYALRLTNGFGFLNPQVIRRSIKIFRKHAFEVYGIYGFVVALDVFVGWVSTVATFFTFGLFWLIAPLYYLLLRYWVKGFAYGILGQRLVQAGTLVPKKYGHQPDLIDSDIV